MNAAGEVDAKVEELGRASRRAALLSLVGFLVVVAAIFYAAAELRSLGRQRAVLLRDQETLKAEIARQRSELTSVQADLAKSRASLSAARAAINAFHAGRLEEAVSLYDEALGADPENAYVQNLRAYALFRLHRIEEAVKGQRRSVAADPNYAWGYFDLARFLCAATPPRAEEARQAAAKAIALRPDMRKLMRNDGEFRRVCGGRLP